MSRSLGFQILCVEKGGCAKTGHLLANVPGVPNLATSFSVGALPYSVHRHHICASRSTIPGIVGVARSQTSHREFDQGCCFLCVSMEQHLKGGSSTVLSFVSTAL